MNYWMGYLILFIMLSGCSLALSEEEKRKNLEEQVLSRHDEVMNKMEEIQRLQMTLHSYLNQPDTLKSDNSLLKKQLAELSNADAAMMNWMHQYHCPKSLSTADATNYLLNQLIKIEQVQKLTESALEKAKKTIYTHENTSI